MELVDFEYFPCLVPLGGVVADLILDAYMVPNFNSGSDFVCWDQYSCAGMFLFLKAFSLSSIHVLCRRYLPGRIGMRSLVGLPKMHIVPLWALGHSSI